MLSSYNVTYVTGLSGLICVCNGSIYIHSLSLSHEVLIDPPLNGSSPLGVRHGPEAAAGEGVEEGLGAGFEAQALRDRRAPRARR